MRWILLLISLATFTSGCNVAFESQALEPVDLDASDGQGDVSTDTDTTSDTGPVDVVDDQMADTDLASDSGPTDMPVDAAECSENAPCGNLEVCENGVCVPCPGANTCGACIPQAPCDPSDPDLLGCWTFDNDDNRGILDSSLYGHDGVPNPLAFSYAPGIDDQALEFNGANTGVSIARTSVLEYDDRRPFSLDAWVRVDASNADGTRMGILDHDTRYAIFAYDTGFRCIFDSTQGFTAGDVVIGQWTHVACVFDGTTLRLYQDGVEVGSDSDTRDPVMSDQELQIGANSPSGDGLVGAVDNVRIINRGLTPAEVCVAASRGGP